MPDIPAPRGTYASKATRASSSVRYKAYDLCQSDKLERPARGWAAGHNTESDLSVGLVAGGDQYTHPGRRQEVDVTEVDDDRAGVLADSAGDRRLQLRRGEHVEHAGDGDDHGAVEPLFVDRTACRGGLLVQGSHLTGVRAAAREGLAARLPSEPGTQYMSNASTFLRRGDHAEKFL